MVVSGGCVKVNGTKVIGEMTPEELVSALDIKDIIDRLAGTVRVSEQYPVAYRQDIDVLLTGRTFYAIASDPKTHFIKAVEVGGRLDETLMGLGASVQKCPVLAAAKIPLGRGKTMSRCPIKTNKIVIRRIVMRSKSEENVANDWAVMLWALKDFDGGPSGSLSSNSLIGMVRLKWMDAKSCFFHDSGEIYIPYEDLDGEYSVHVSLLNEGPFLKKRGKAGELFLLIFYEMSG